LHQLAVAIEADNLIRRCIMPKKCESPTLQTPDKKQTLAGDSAMDVAPAIA
jgi:hypothetical protein